MAASELSAGSGSSFAGADPSAGAGVAGERLLRAASSTNSEFIEFIDRPPFLDASSLRQVRLLRQTRCFARAGEENPETKDVPGRPSGPADGLIQRWFSLNTVSGRRGEVCPAMIRFIQFC